MSNKKHIPQSKYRAGFWRSVRQPWMTDAVWAALQALRRKHCKK